ncbi:MAG TPA: gluconokinase [Gaiellaceae bacterium]|nr:gluconokinase [Gaiellaceae bacterium]
MTSVLAVDLGSSSVRARVFDERGEPVDELRQAAYGGDDPHEIVRLVREVVAGRDERTDAVGVSSFGHSLVALDASGRPLTPVLGWRDIRAAGAAAELRRRTDADAAFARTGQHLHPAFWPAKLLWLAETEPETFGAAARFVSAADVVYAELTGAEPVESVSLASSTGLLDIHRTAWDAELLELVGVGEERLPRVGDEAGGRWFPALFDGACSNLGAGCTGRARAALMVGTSAALRVLYETDAPDPKPGLFLYRLDGRRVVEGGALSDGGNLYAWLGTTLVPGGDPPRPDHGLTFVPFLGGERSTGWDATATGTIAGLTFAATPADIRRAALEGVAFRIAAIAERMPGLEEVVATGSGLLRDPAWIQVMADALARPVTASGVEEASLRGAAVAALQRLGYEPVDAPLGETYAPHEERVDAYRSARERQERLIEVMRGDD